MLLCCSHYYGIEVQWNLLTIISEGTTENKQFMRENDSCEESILMCHKHEKTKSEHFTFFLLTKNEQIKGNLKYLSTNNILHVTFYLKHNVSDKTTPILS
jgi:hypothetical protein